MIKKKANYLIWLFRLFFVITINKIQFLAKIKTRPYRFLVKVTSCCNYQCQRCGSWKEKDRSFLSSEQQQKIITQSGGKLFFLSLTGGEPFLFQEKLLDFIEKMITANPNLRKISVNTNCSLSDGVYSLISTLLSKHHSIDITVGLHYITSKKWGREETGIDGAYSNYLKTRNVMEELSSLFPKRVHYYNMVTVGSKRELLLLKKYTLRDKPRDLWLNFATTNSFYGNAEKVNSLSSEKQHKASVWFLKNFSPFLSFMNRKYLQELIKIKALKRRKRRCYAGVNRLYFNEKGEQQICAMGVVNRANMNKQSCKNCWTACEANFDLLEDLFLPTLFNCHQRDTAK